MTIKKTVSLLLALLMIFSCAASFTACKNNKDDNIDDLPKAKRTSVYKEEPLDIKIAANYIDRVMCDGENLLMTYYKNYTIVYDNEGKEVERLDGYYYNYGGNDEVFFYDEAVSYARSSSVMMTVPDKNADADSDGKEKEDLKGEVDEFGVITDENRNIQVPEGWWTNWESEQVISSVPISGGDVKTIPLKFDSILKGVDENGEEKELYSYGYVNSLFVGNDGKPRILYNAYSYDEVTYESKTGFYILTIDVETGEVTDQKLLNDSFKSAGINEDDYVYINSVALLDNGNIVFSMESKIYQVDGDMKLVKIYEVSDGDGYAELLSIGEKVIVGMYDYNSGKYIFKYIADGELRDVNTDADLSRFGSFVGGYGDRIYAQSDMSVMYLDIVTGEVGEELNFINSDIDFTRISSIALIGDGKMVMTSNDWSSEDSSTKFSVMTKVPDDQIEEEVILTLGSVYQNYRLIRSIMRFNKKGTGVRINFKSYNQYNNQENEWKGAVTQLNSEIISGTLPDILYLTSDLPVQSYFNKGYFVDLNKYIDDSEKGLDRSKYFDNILRANETNGKLYSFISTFSLYTLAAKTEFVGSEPGWTFEEMMKVVNSMPEGMELMYGMGRDSIVSTMIEGSLSSYVNWSTGETKFDTPEFIQFITYLKTCPEKGLWEEYYDSMQMGDEYIYDEEAEREIQEKMQLRFWNNSALLEGAYISGFESLQWVYNEFATKDVTFIGFPTNDEGGNGVLISPNAEFAISAKSKAKALAWEAVKGLIEDTDDNYNFSIIREKTDEIEKTVYERIEKDENNNYEEDYSWYEEYGYSEDYINYMKNSNVKLDRKMVQDVRNFIENASAISRTDDQLYDLINEELSGFFGGAKSAEDTARVISRRARVLISEKS